MLFKMHNIIRVFLLNRSSPILKIDRKNDKLNEVFEYSLECKKLVELVTFRVGEMPNYHCWLYVDVNCVTQVS